MPGRVATRLLLSEQPPLALGPVRVVLCGPQVSDCEVVGTRFAPMAVWGLTR